MSARQCWSVVICVIFLSWFDAQQVSYAQGDSLAEAVSLAFSDNESDWRRADALAAQSEPRDGTQVRIGLAEMAVDRGDRLLATQILQQTVLSLRTASLEAWASERLREAARLQARLDDAQTAALWFAEALVWDRARLGDDNPALVDALRELAEAQRALGAPEAAGSEAELTRLERIADNRAAEDGTRGSGVQDDPNAQLEIVRVFYATDRMRVPSRSGPGAYTGSTGAFEYGEATVSVPKAIAAPVAPRNFALLRLEFRPSQDRTPTIERVRAMRGGLDELLVAAQSRIARSTRRERLLYIHGYNQSFADAATRAAKLSIDLEIDGAVFFYSWPSQASFLAYGVDAQIAADARRAEHVANFIRALADRTDGAPLTIIAHSMGNSILLNALEALKRPPSGRAPALGDIVFAAPDVGVDRFLASMANIRGLGERMTLYASARDRALQASRLFNGMTRAGERAFVLPEVLDSIDTSGASRGLLGHDDFAGTARDDLRAILWTGLDPPARCILSSDGAAWRLGAQPRCNPAAFAGALLISRRWRSRPQALSALEAEIAHAAPDRAALWEESKRILNTMP